jgi:hypothetical protein
MHHCCLISVSIWRELTTRLFQTRLLGYVGSAVCLASRWSRAKIINRIYACGTFYVRLRRSLWTFAAGHYVHSIGSFAVAKNVQNCCCPQTSCIRTGLYARRAVINSRSLWRRRPERRVTTIPPCAAVVRLFPDKTARTDVRAHHRRD